MSDAMMVDLLRRIAVALEKRNEILERAAMERRTAAADEAERQETAAAAREAVRRLHRDIEGEDE